MSQKTLYKGKLLKLINSLISRLASLKGENIPVVQVVYYYLSASEIWPGEMSDLEWEGLIREKLLHDTNRKNSST